jgi:hypothetical protein
MASVKVSGKIANNWFAEQLVQDLGADEARNRTCGYMREAVEQAILSGVAKDCSDERKAIVKLAVEIGQGIEASMTA